MSYYCEMCGREVDAKVAKRAVVEGSPLILCPECYSKLSRKSAVREESLERARSTQQLRSVQQTSVARSSRSVAGQARIAETYEIVENYHQLIKSARERLGWSQEVLASKVGESVNTIRRIEAGKLKPTIELARKLERVLKIKLLEPVVAEPLNHVSSSRVEDLTIGDLIDTRKYGEKTSKGSR
ncbi:MAG: multiprotein bridging factor aMBF1 [Desulfurococcaceae archaeon]